MTTETLEQTATRIARPVHAHQLSAIEVVLHGGEPLLAGADFLAVVARTLRSAVGEGTAVEIAMQTNGVLLDSATLDVLGEHGIGVGVSVDGGAVDHDRRRLYPDGRGSHRDVAAALRLLGSPSYRSLYRGLLCTIDLAADPLATYSELAEFAPPALDLLLPHGNWDNPPPGVAADATPYADWLIPIFDRWYSAPSPQPRVRLFDEVLSLLLGGRSRLESIGPEPSTVIVVETDGAIEQVDVLKSAYAGAAETGLHVTTDDFDAALQHPAVRVRQAGISGLSQVCRDCALVEVCGGGYYPHRYSSNSGFDNSSVYCGDLMKLIRHILMSVQTDLAGKF